ncbi:xaa-pro aminopeptidase [Niveomyces insectorum RCEF 264]|uniref:Probable Xaa-Pro aminopeptidase P n=1 Tax=Niveomyces insectorum RCEF 264 TaxID=1081102 RepID=A0A167R9W9_9HYPO|nr:xaa-pro aminopeptidase [Niveomyces insectorum RCEF 264]
METVETGERLAALRKLMAENEIDVYVVPSEDAHSSEYIAPCDARREFISGFSGSAGCAVVSHDKAVLATDGRYFNQAARQLDDRHWVLLKQGLQDVPTWQEWAASAAASGQGSKRVGVDPTLLASTTAAKLDEKIKKTGGEGLVAVSNNLVDAVWAATRPPRPTEPVVLLPETLAGKAAADKLADLRTELSKKHAAGFVVSMLDEVAWLFNLRGSDIPYNPVFFSYALVTADAAALYVDATKLSDACAAYLAQNNVTIKPYDTIFADTARLGAAVAAADAVSNAETTSAAAATTTSTGTTAPPPTTPAPATPQKVLLSNRASWALNLALGGEDRVEEIRSPLGDAKAIKNDTELEGMRQCHIRDGAALISYFAWLEAQLQAGAAVDEVAAADKLEALRAQQAHFVGLSFPTISSTGANAAIIHYKPERGSCAVLDPNAIYLCDSGAQYLDGTTDTTRTVHFGTPTSAERKAYTLVLKGNIALDRAVFPKGTTGFALDAFARQFLWQEGLDYRHGTGHGVGSYLNVHEGPIGIGTRKQYAEVALAAGNVTSIEPGFYEDGAYGIRIENMALVREVQTTHAFGDKPYLGFEHVTMVPYCRALIDTALLTDKEKDWLNDYNQLILDKTAGFFKDDATTLAWLKKETQPF